MISQLEAPARTAGARLSQRSSTTDRRRTLDGRRADAAGARRARRHHDLSRSAGPSGSASTGPTPRCAARPTSRGSATTRASPARASSRRRSGRRCGLVAASFVLEAIIGLAVALALHRGLRGSKIFSRHRRPAADGGAGRRRARLALHLRRRLRHDRLDRWRSSAASGPLWFADIWLARASIVIANLWMALPFDILVLLAGLASLPTDPIEAAQVDGASPRQILVTIILPLLKPVIAVILVVRLADAFRIFDVVYVLTGSGPANSTDVLSTYIYRQMFTVLRFSRRRRGGGAAGADHRRLLAACRAAPSRPRAGGLDGRRIHAARSASPISGPTSSSSSSACSSSCRSTGSSRPRSSRPARSS